MPNSQKPQSTLSDLEPLIEDLAEEVHIRWMETRLNQGWTHGPKRDDDIKQHPSLIPYLDLSEDEKDLDRETARQTIQSIIDRGYNIVPARP